MLLVADYNETKKGIAAFINFVRVVSMSPLYVTLPSLPSIARLPNSPNTKVGQIHLCHHLVCISHSD